MAKVCNQSDPKGDRRRLIARVCLAAMVLGACGCERLVVSLYPIGTDADWICEPNLAGTWIWEDQSWQFSPAGSSGFALRLVEGLKAAEFKARLTRIAGRILMDLEPNGLPVDLPATVSMHLIGTHSIWQVTSNGSRLVLRRMDRQALERILASDPNALEHVQVHDQMVLTAPPNRLRQFLASHLDANDLWQAGPDLRRAGPFEARPLLIQDLGLDGRWQAQELQLWIRPVAGRLMELTAIANDGPCLRCWSYLIEIQGKRVLVMFTRNKYLQDDGFPPSVIPEAALLADRSNTQLAIRPLGLGLLYDLMQGRQVQLPGDALVLRKVR